MAKDPAFLFYPNDWIGGTMGMTFEEKGAYMEILMLQFNRGHMTSHMIGQTVGQLWDKIKDKFRQDSEGLWYNSRLEEEKTKRKKFTLSRNNNINGTNQHTKPKKEKLGHTTSHMEDANEDYNTTSISSTQSSLNSEKNNLKNGNEKNIGFGENQLSGIDILAAKLKPRINTYNPDGKFGATIKAV